MQIKNSLRHLSALIAALAIAFTLTACGDGDSHDHDSHDDHDHEQGETHNEEAPQQTLGTVELEGRTVTVMLSGELAPKTMYEHCHLKVAGERVDAMRIWIGEPSGEGALKSKVTGLGKHPTVNLETPDSLEGAVLGVEIEIAGKNYQATAAIGQ